MNGVRARRLAKIADDLDTVTARLEQLYEQRLAEWRKGLDAGETAAELSVPSRVKAVTVRQTLFRAGKGG